jgi:S-(hydroxymethyl)glutathione dehydrogenase/alcohol dehydrogenase
MNFTAAVMEATNAPFVLRDVRLASFGPNDVLVRIEAAGLCHTDLEAMQGSFAAVTPAILGHEGAGVVEDVGRNVTHLRKGDHVVCSPFPSCGGCYYCRRAQPMLCEPVAAGHRQGRLPDGGTRITCDGRPISQFLAISSFAQYAVVPEQGAIRIPAEMPLDRACLLGCAVLTGVGAVTRIARVRPGDSCCVIGAGPVGLNAVQGARLAGAEIIVVSDTDPARLALAVQLGATLAVDPRDRDIVQVARELTSGRGADHVFETAGNEGAMRSAMEATRPGGNAVILGKVEPNADVSFRFGSLMGDKTIRRSALGGGMGAEDIPALAQSYIEGKLLLDPLITERLPLGRINDGIAHLAARSSIRTVVTPFQTNGAIH